MGTLTKIFARTLIGGVLFLLPLALILFLVGHLFAILRPPAEKVAEFVGEAEMGPAWLTLAIIGVLLISAFLLGLAATTGRGQLVTQRLETVMLSLMPGYSIIKSAAADAAASVAAIDQSTRKKAVLVRDGDAWQIGFVTGQAGPDMFAVFLPDAPAPESGTLVLMGEDRFIDSGLSVSEALACLRRVGADMPPLPVDRPSRGDRPSGDENNGK